MQVLTERQAAPGDEVTVGFLDGHTQRTYLARFSPYVADLTVSADPARIEGRGKQVRTLIPAERVAFVAFHRPASAKPPVPSSEPREGASLKVHVAGGKSFLVEPPIKGAQDAVGFYARPWDRADPYREFFFYTHGINAKEIRGSRSWRTSTSPSGASRRTARSGSSLPTARSSCASPPFRP